MTPYEPLYTKTFSKTVDKYSQLKKKIEKLVAKILPNPKLKSRLLKKKKGIDLTGCRRRHLDPNFVVIYIFCEECIEAKPLERKKNRYWSFCKEELRKTVIFVAFEKHKDIYAKQWKVENSTF